MTTRVVNAEAHASAQMAPVINEHTMMKSVSHSSESVGMVAGVCDRTAIPHLAPTRLSDEQYYTDDTSCAMDAFNLCVGKALLSRKLIGVPRSEKGIAYDQMRPVIESLGFACVQVGTMGAWVVAV